jgi:hypothetical protein
VPYLVEREPEYLLLLPSPLWLAVWFIAAAAILIVVRRAVRQLTPILLLTLPLVAVALLASPLRRAAGPWLYFGFDLFWWLVAAVVALIVVERRPSLSIPSRSRWGFELALAVVLLASSLLASPRLRFQSVLVGDEPKYLRYLENWYRGQGMDVSRLGPIADLPPGESSHVTMNLARLGRALSDESRDLITDAAPGRASSQGGWFVDGKRGGVYQVHNPGISFLLFPGYLIDRTVSATQLWHPQFPTNLYGTGTIVLLLYLLWSLSTFRLLHSHTHHAALSWIIAAILFLSLPVAAFAYQYYPEVAAGLIVALLVRYTMVSADRRGLAAAGHGLLAAFLPWLHLRFAPLTVLAVVVFALTRRRDRPALASFGAGLVVPLAALRAHDCWHRVDRAIAVPALGSYTGALTTPAAQRRRAAAFLCAASMAETVLAYASPRAFVAAFALLGVISVQNAHLQRASDQERGVAPRRHDRWMAVPAVAAGSGGAQPLHTACFADLARLRLRPARLSDGHTRRRFDFSFEVVDRRGRYSCRGGRCDERGHRRSHRRARAA